MTEAPIHDQRTSERRAGWHTPEDCNNMQTVNAKFDEGTKRMQRIEQSIADVNSKLDDHVTTSRVTSEGVSEVLSILTAANGFFKVVGWFGFVVKWALAIFIPVLTFLHLVKGGGK